MQKASLHVQIWEIDSLTQNELVFESERIGLGLDIRIFDAHLECQSRGYPKPLQLYGIQAVTGGLRFILLAQLNYAQSGHTYDPRKT